MAIGDNYFDCATVPVDVWTMLKSLFVSDGSKIYVNMRVYTGDECPVSAVDCGTWQEFESLLNASIEIDACGNPALRVMTGVNPQ